MHIAVLAAQIATSAVSITPTSSGLPGTAQVQSIANGVDAWALLASVVAMVVGAASWAFGAHSQNYHQSVLGRRTVLVSVVAALIIGAAPHLINFFFSQGQGVSSSGG